jgi:surface protein
MIVGIRISSDNYSGSTAFVTFEPTTGGTVTIGNTTVPFNYFNNYPYGIYYMYFSSIDYTCSFTVTPPTPTSTPTNTPTINATPTVTPTNTITPTITPTSAIITCELLLVSEDNQYINTENSDIISLAQDLCPSQTPTNTPTVTPTPETPTPTPTNTITPTVTPTNTVTPTTPPLPFISVWQANSPIELPYSPSGIYSGTIDWGDGSVSANTYANRIHDYAVSGTYTITISGTITGWNFGNYANSYRSSIKEIIQWGQLRGEFGSNLNMFFGCSNLVLTGVTDTPNLIGVTNLQNMFVNCSSLTTVNNMNSWNVSNITNMSGMFAGATLFNQNIGSWNVSGVTSMQSMFLNATAFNQNIGNWNVSNVTNMESMFLNATSFNQNISNWDVSKVTNMSQMFQSVPAFNQDIGNWNVSGVTSMQSM